MPLILITFWARLLRTLLAFVWLASLALFFSCENPLPAAPNTTGQPQSIGSEPFIVVLGIAQDAGYPQAGCQKDCCREAWGEPLKRRLASCIAVVDPSSAKAWMIDATPDFKDQLYRLENILPGRQLSLAGIFLSHAHIGHYTGLVHLGREVMGAKGTPVYAMPRMKSFLENNGPWSQLVTLQNISLRNLAADSMVILNRRIKIRPVPVPHRDEFSETVGFKIEGPQKSLLYIPDIDKWDLWEKDILHEIAKVDYALLDGSFYQNGEIPGRDMSEIPHPFITESMEIFRALPAGEKAKIHFIHFNHTNPVLLENSAAGKSVLEMGLGICGEGEVFWL
ncbi:MAG TPA: pyrroloquinoline quinone biosynthesis protein PqqB [Bacteroidetes bacterium]|nr:pyrroloquinoline quinone biosynthesis protein PqqB [Bacteroidota bacterium]